MLTSEQIEALKPALQNEIDAWGDADCGEHQAENDRWVAQLREIRALLADVDWQAVREAVDGDWISRDSIIEALRDAHENDSAADAVEFVSDLVGWSAEDDAEASHE